MTNVGSLERAVQPLTPHELTTFRTCCQEYDAGAREAQVAREIRAGRFDHLAERPIQDDADCLSAPR